MFWWRRNINIRKECSVKTVSSVANEMHSLTAKSNTVQYLVACSQVYHNGSIVLLKSHIFLWLRQSTKTLHLTFWLNVLFQKQELGSLDWL